MCSERARDSAAPRWRTMRLPLSLFFSATLLPHASASRSLQCSFLDRSRAGRKTRADMLTLFSRGSRTPGVEHALHLTTPHSAHHASQRVTINNQARPRAVGTQLARSRPSAGQSGLFPFTLFAGHTRPTELAVVWVRAPLKPRPGAARVDREAGACHSRRPWGWSCTGAWSCSCSSAWLCA
jgi:hypothetical protein